MENEDPETYVWDEEGDDHTPEESVAQDRHRPRAGVWNRVMSNITGDIHNLFGGVNELFEWVDEKADRVGDTIHPYASATEERPVIDVTHPAYGAEGDGNTDDTSAINSAIDRAESIGGVVKFPEGVYIFSEQLEFDGIPLVADNREATLRVSEDVGTLNDPNVIRMGGERPQLRGLTIDGNMLDRGANDHLVRVTAAEEPIVHDCRLMGGGRGSPAEDAGGSMLVFETVEPSEGGDSDAPIEGGYIGQNTFSDPDHNAEFLVRFKTDWAVDAERDEFENPIQECLIEGNRFVGGAKAAVELSGPATVHNTVRSCHSHDFRGGGNGIFCADYGASWNLFEDVTVHEPIADNDVGDERLVGIGGSGMAEDHHGTHPLRISEGNTYSDCSVLDIRNAQGQDTQLVGMEFRRARDVTLVRPKIDGVYIVNPVEEYGRIGIRCRRDAAPVSIYSPNIRNVGNCISFIQDQEPLVDHGRAEYVVVGGHLRDYDLRGISHYETESEIDLRVLGTTIVGGEVPFQISGGRGFAVGAAFKEASDVAVRVRDFADTTTYARIGFCNFRQNEDTYDVLEGADLMEDFNA